MRLSTKSNPLGLNLGERVKYWRSCEVKYDEEDRKKVFFEASFNAPLSCVITGSVKKALGKYRQAEVDGFAPSFEPEYRPACLEVSEYIWLYECRTVIHKKSFLVHPNDIVLEE